MGVVVFVCVCAHTRVCVCVFGVMNGRLLCWQIVREATDDVGAAIKAELIDPR